MIRLVLSFKSFTVCSTFHTPCDIGDGLIFLRRFFPQKRRLQPKFFVHHCLYAEVSLLSFSKREFHLAACAFEKTASFRTQLSTYSRRFITSVEHENSGEHEISDLSTDLSLSLSTVYNLGPRCLHCFSVFCWLRFSYILHFMRFDTHLRNHGCVLCCCGMY